MRQVFRLRAYPGPPSRRVRCERSNGAGPDVSPITAVRPRRIRGAALLPPHFPILPRPLSAANVGTYRNGITVAQATQGVNSFFTLERVIADLDVLRNDIPGARGAARTTLLDRLIAIDAALIAAARTAAGASFQDIQEAARAELAPFKARMAEAPFARALTACTDRLLSEHFRLPTVRFE